MSGRATTTLPAGSGPRAGSGSCAVFKSRAYEGPSIGSLVVVDGQLAIICGINEKGRLLIFRLNSNGDCTLCKVEQAGVTLLPLAVSLGLVPWANANAACGRGLSNMQTVIELLIDACVFDGCAPKLARVVRALYDAARGVSPVARPADSGTASSAVFARAVLLRLRDGDVCTRVSADEAVLRERVGELLGQLVTVSGQLCAKLASSARQSKCGPIPQYAKDMLDATTLDQRIKVALRAMNDVQGTADKIVVSPDDALLAAVGAFAEIGGQVVEHLVLVRGLAISFAPNMRYHAQLVADHLSDIMVGGLGSFTVVDIGAGCGAACAAFNAAGTAVRAKAAEPDTAEGPATATAESATATAESATATAESATATAESATATAESATATAESATATAESATATGHAIAGLARSTAGSVRSTAGSAKSAGPAACVEPVSRAEPVVVYRGSNGGHGYAGGAVVAGENDGVERTTATTAASFARFSLELVEPRSGDPVQTVLSGRKFTFLRWTKGGNKAVVVGAGGRVLVCRDNMVFYAVMVIAWAPDGEEENFLPDLLRLLLKIRRPLNGLFMLVSGEGPGGCTGNGDPFVHRVLAATPSVHEEAFSQGRAQVPGITSRATLFRVEDVVATLRAAASAGFE